MKLYNTEQTAKMLGISIVTLNKYSGQEKLVPIKNSSNRCFYTEEMIQDYINNSYVYENDNAKYKVVQEEPVRITLNYSKLVSLDIYDVKTGVKYYKIPKEMFKNWSLDVIKRTKTDEGYYVELGKLENRDSNLVFVSYIDWRE